MRGEDIAILIAGVAIILAVTGWLVMGLPAHAASCAGTIMRASYYGAESGSKTADGSFFDGTQMVAAHKSLPFGTKLRVTYRGKSVDVVVRDRGPFIKGRQLDLSRAAAARIGMIPAGVASVCVVRK